MEKGIDARSTSALARSGDYDVAGSPGMFRAFVPLTNIDAFYAAFNLKPGDKLYRAPAERVKIW